MAVSDTPVHSSNHGAIHAALHDALFVYGHEAWLTAKLSNPAFIQDDPAHVYTTALFFLLC